MLDFEGVDEVPEILTTEQADYVYALAKDIVRSSLSVQLRDIVLLLGLPRRQEKALKNLVIAALSGYLYCFRQGIGLVTAEEDDTKVPEIVKQECKNCQFTDFQDNDEPCRTCNDHDNWSPKEPMELEEGVN